MIFRQAFLMLSLGLLLVSCQYGDNAKTQDGKSQISTTMQHLQNDKATVQHSTSGSFLATIFPEPLTSADRADAIVSNCQEEMFFQWEVNDIELLGHEATSLDHSFFQRGDSIKFIAQCGAQIKKEVVIVQNSPPVISAVKFQSPELVSGRGLTVLPIAKDLDGDPIDYSYEWVLDGVLVRDIGGATLPGHLLKKGTQVTLAITPFDNFSDGTTFQGLSFSIPNTAPTIGSQPPPLSSSSDLYVYSVKAADPDNDELVYRLNQGPAGMVIDKKTGYLSWPIDQNTPIGNFDIEIIVEDPEELQARQFYTLSLTK